MSALWDLVSLGGHGFYVWTAYAIWLVVLLLNVAMARRHQRETTRSIARQIRIQSKQS